MLELDELAKRSDKIIDLFKCFRDAFGIVNDKAHVKLAIMAGIHDAYQDGYEAGLTDAKVKK